MPVVLQHQLPQLAQSALERPLTVGAVRFNPFTLRLEAHDLRLTEVDGSALLAVGTLALELDWRSLLKRAWSLGEIRLTAPAVSLAVAPDGSVNLARLLATLNRKPASPDSAMPRLVFRHFVLEHGKVSMRDLRAGYADTYAPIDLALNNLSTLPDQNGDYTFRADAGHGGTLRWKGSNALNPVSGSGLLTLDKVALPGLSAYLKSITRVTLTDGKLSASFPYRFSYQNGKFDASLNGASLTVRDLALTPGTGQPFAKARLFAISAVNADLGHRTVTVGAVQLADGLLAARRSADGAIDLANLALPAPTSFKAAPAPAAASRPGAPADQWKVHFAQVQLDRIALSAVDDTVNPPLTLSADQLQLRLKANAGFAPGATSLTVADAALSLAGVSMRSGTQTPFKLAQFGFADGALDLAGGRVSVGRLVADGGQFDLARDGKGRWTILEQLPTFAATPATAAADTAAAGGQTPWLTQIGRIELKQFSASVDDASLGLKTAVQEIGVTLQEVSSDRTRPVAFKAQATVLQGGQLAMEGSLVPATGLLESDLKVKQLALAPVQPVLAKYLKLTLADGNLNAQGHLTLGAGNATQPALRYVGALDVASLVLNEDDGDLFSSWKSLRADKLSLNLTPNSLSIPELRLVAPNGKLIIERDRSVNATRLLVTPPAPASPAVVAAAAPPVSEAAPPAPGAAPRSDVDAPFPVRVRRLRIQDAKLDFTDLSLPSPFVAKIYELNGVVTGLSTQGNARSQIELDGRVDDFGLARVRGQLNPFVPADNTDLNVLFKNIDLVSATPYAVKFAGYKIAEGKISLDLQYKVRDNQLEGQNRISIDRLTLGEHSDSPDALKLPVELALALLKDSDGRIELGLPVAGNMRDPQFSYGAVVRTALGNVLGKIVASPFRALGNMFGVSGDKLEAVEFDAGSAGLLPPEQEKLQQIARLLAKRAQLKLSVPGQYSEAADGAAIRTRTLRRTVATRAGLRLEPGEAPGPYSFSERKVRAAVRELYAERFGAAELEREKLAAEAAASVPAAPGAAAGTTAGTTATPAASERADGNNRSQPGAAGAAVAASGANPLPVLQRLGKLVQGEPQVADPAAFYGKLQQRLEQAELLAPDALTVLGEQRAQTVRAALVQAGVESARVEVTPAQEVTLEAGRPVALTLALSAK